METLFTIIFLVSLVGFIVGLIAPKLVIVWGDKKTRGRVFLAYGSATIISLVILGLVTSSDEQGSQEQQIARQASQTPTNPYLLEWQEIDARTKALKHDRDSMRDVWLYLAEKNEKWQVVEDKSIKTRAHKVKDPRFKPSGGLYSWHTEQVSTLKKLFQGEILGRIVFNEAKPLDVSFAEFNRFAYSNGFHFTEGTLPGAMWGHKSARIYKEVTVKKGKQKGTGAHFTAEMDSNGNILELSIPLGAKYTYGEYLKKHGYKFPPEKFYFHDAKRVYSNPDPWVAEFFTLFFGSEAQTIMDRIKAIADADKDKLKEMMPGKSPKFSCWNIEFVTENGKKIDFSYFSGRGSIHIKTIETFDAEKKFWEFHKKDWKGFKL